MDLSEEVEKLRQRAAERFQQLLVKVRRGFGSIGCLWCLWCRMRPMRRAMTPALNMLRSSNLWCSSGESERS